MIAADTISAEIARRRLERERRARREAERLLESKSLELYEANRALTELARTDPLTRLFNRRAFMIAMEARFAERNADPFALLYLDLDGFKPINDRFGHSCGDFLLQAMAERLDACSEIEAVARLGGDEFAALSRAPKTVATALALAETIADLLAKPLVFAGQAISVSASVGVALSEGPATTAGELLHGADVAMRWAKARRARARLYDAGLEKARLHDAGVEAEIRAAIPRGEFIPFEQPIVALTDGRVLGWEALMRWDHPTRGVVPPSAFIEVAEATNLIDAMFWPMFTRAAARHAARVDDTFLSVNLTQSQILDDRLTSRLATVLSETGLSAQRLEIEITEREPVRDVERLAAKLEDVVSLGIRIALDDFGTGGANLTLLRSLPLHTLKVDRSFVADILDDARDERILAAMIGLARSMGMTLTAEGIESAAIAERLRALGCEQGQGYLYARPSAHGPSNSVDQAAAAA